jgi:Transposase DDE domain
VRHAARPAAKKRSLHDPRQGDPARVSEEAFVQARRRVPLALWTCLLLVLSERFEHAHGERLRWKRFRLLALDGTCVDLPNRQSLKQSYGCAKNGAGSWTPQARMVLLQFPLVRLPWRYELHPLAVGERTIAASLLRHVQADDLVLMDQGFWSYGLFQQLQSQGAYFAIRCIPQVKFRTTRKLGPNDRLVCWRPADRQWQRAGLPETYTLRVIRYQIRGFRPSAVVTNVLDPHEVSREDWVRLSTETEAGSRLNQGLYHRRWEIETSFLEMKTMQGLERGLRGRTPEAIAYEIAGHVLLYFLIRWLIVEAAVEHGCQPLELSFIDAWRELQHSQHSLLTATASRVAILVRRLLERIASHRVLYRPGRHNPRPGDTRTKNLGYGRIRKPHKLLTKTRR